MPDPFAEWEQRFGRGAPTAPPGTGRGYSPPPLGAPHDFELLRAGLADHERRIAALERRGGSSFPHNPPVGPFFVPDDGARFSTMPVPSAPAPGIPAGIPGGPLAAAGVALTSVAVERERNVFANPGTGALVATGAPLAVRAVVDPLGTAGRYVSRVFGGGRGRPLTSAELDALARTTGVRSTACIVPVPGCPNYDPAHRAG